MRTIVVTRHAALVELLREVGLVDGTEAVLSHVEDPRALRGARVIGVLPLHLAAEACEVVEVPLALTPEDRGVELGLDRLREIAGAPRAYRVVPVALPGAAAEAELWRAAPTCKGTALVVLGPVGTKLPCRGHLDDLGTGGHVHALRVRPDPEAPTIVAAGESLEALSGALEVAAVYLGGCGGPSASVLLCAPGARLRSYGYKRRTSTDYEVQDGVLRALSDAEASGGRPATDVRTALADKLREAGVI